MLWDGLGTLLWTGSTFMPDTFMAGMRADHRAYVNGLPGWTSFTWGLGVLGGLLGAEAVRRVDLRGSRWAGSSLRCS